MRTWLLSLAIVAAPLGGLNLKAADAPHAKTDAQATAQGLTVTAPLDYQVAQRRTLREGSLPIAGRCSVPCDRPNKPLNEAGSRGGQKILWDRKVAFEGPDTDHMLGDLRCTTARGSTSARRG